MDAKSELLEKYLSAPTLSDILTRDVRPIVLYGTGNGADKVISYLETLGKKPDAIFASDGFVRDRMFAGLPVESLRAVTDRHGDDIMILMCFGSDREEVLSYVAELDARYDFFIPDVPLYGGGIFDKEYLTSHIDVISEARELLSDDASRELFDDVVMYRLGGKYKYLQKTVSFEDACGELLSDAKIRCAVDCGAYRGETAQMLLRTFPECETVFALEPDPVSYRKLSELAAERDGKDGAIVPMNFAAYDDARELTFSASSSRGAGVEGKNRRSAKKIVHASPLDLLPIGRADLIKFDVEGDEERALRGAQGMLRKNSPCLAVSLYHRTGDIWRIPLMIRAISPEYSKMKFYIRRPRCVPAWDLTLFCVKDVTEEIWN